MTVKKKVVRKMPRPKTRARVRGTLQPPYPSFEEVNYERALGKSVLDFDLALQSEDGATLAAAMSSLTDSLKKLSYNYGLTVGRSVYKLFEGRKHYKWYGDSIQDIVLFFERLGYNYIQYKILTDNVEIEVYRKEKSPMGCSIHSFDAGMVAGFLGAARGDFVRVSEVECCNNAGECCRFTTAGSPGDPFCTDIRKLAVLVNGAPSKGVVRPEYQMLVTEPLMKQEYSAQMGTIFTHLGQAADTEPEKTKISAKAVQKAATVMERLGLGRLNYSPRPLKLEIMLDGVKAKKEFVDISISFLNGLVGSHFSKPLKSQLTKMKSGSYKIIVKQ